MRTERVGGESISHIGAIVFVLLGFVLGGELFVEVLTRIGTRVYGS